MKILNCKDINALADCNFIARGESVKEVVSMMMEHAAEDHTEDFEGMKKTMSAQQIQTLMESKVKEEAMA